MHFKLITAVALLALGSAPSFAQNAIGVGTGISNSRSDSAAIAAPVQNNRNTATAGAASQSRSNSNSNVNSRISSQQNVGVRSVNANQSGAANTNTFNSTTTGQSPSVFAPGMSAAGIESCNGSVSLGGAAVGGGGALGFPWQDGPCNKRLNARTLWAFGQHEAALQTLCLDDELARSMVAGGIKCRVGAYAEVAVVTPHSAYRGEFKSAYHDKKGRAYTVADCHSKGARPSADPGVCVKPQSMASN
jgi:hypothetical protein